MVNNLVRLSLLKQFAKYQNVCETKLYIGPIKKRLIIDDEIKNGEKI